MACITVRTKILNHLHRAHCRAALPGARWTVLFGLLWLTLLPSLAQGTLRETRRTFEPRILGGLQLMGQWPNLAGSTGSAAGLPFIGLGFDLGGSLTYRDRLGLALQGSLVGQGFILSLGNDRLDLYHLTQRFETRAWWVLYGSEVDGNLVRVGLGWGLSVQNHNEDRSRHGGTDYYFREPLQTRPYLVPEVGVITPSGRRRTEFVLRYVVHLDRTPAWVVQASSATGNATFTATDDHLAFAIRFHFGFRKKARPALPRPQVDQQARTVDRLDTLTTRRERLVLWVSDNAEYDGDTLSLLLNGRPVLVAHELTRKPHRVVLYLDQRANTLTVLAHNEGRVPPNTARCTVRTGHGRRTLLLRTGLKASQAVVILRE